MSEMCNDNRFEIIEETKKYIIEATNINTSKDEMKVLDNICFRLWQLGLTKRNKDKLKQLEKIFSDSHICEIKARFNEIECSADKCDNCPLAVGEDICLKITFENKWKFQEERDKLKQAINILKAKGEINLFVNRNNDNKLTLDFDDCISCVLEPKEYALLKEVFEDE